MKKNVMIFGAYGALGKGVTDTLLEKDYDRFYLVNSPKAEIITNDKRIINIASNDLSVETNVIDVFDKIEFEIDTENHLFSAIGGFWGGVPLINTDKENWDRMFRMNLESDFLIAKHFLKLSENGSGGTLCFTSALSGFNPEPARIAYGASKAALNYLIESLAEECKERKIAVLGIAPYILDTPANRKWGREEDFPGWQKPSEIGEIIHFIFNNFHYLSGNIITLKIRFTREKNGQI